MLYIKTFFYFFYLPTFIFFYNKILFYITYISQTVYLVFSSQLFSKWDSLNYNPNFIHLPIFSQRYKGSAHLFLELFMPILIKFAYKGKSYRIRLFKTKKKFTFHVGYSHWVKLLFNITFIRCFKRHRTAFNALTYSTSVQRYFSFIIRTIKKPNYYTLRGVRLKQQVFYRRFRKFK